MNRIKKRYGAKSGRSIHIILGMLVCIWLFVLTGCDAPDTLTLKTSENEAAEESELSTVEAPLTTEEIPQSSIAAKDWEIKKYPVAGTDNLYELPLEELTDSDSYIIDIKSFENQLLVFKETEDAQVGMYLIDPLTTEITAQAVLPGNTYNSEGFRINDDNQIEVLNLETKELFIFDNELQEASHISFGEIQTQNIVIDSNHEYAYYLDNADGCLYQYQIAQQQSTKLFADVYCSVDDYAMVLGLLNNDACLAFCYYSSDIENLVYEVRELATGSVLYHDDAELSGIECFGEAYLLRHYEEGLSEILYGDAGEEVPSVLSLKDYDEYNHVMTNIRSSCVISNIINNDARESYQLLVNENQQKELADDETNVTMLSINQYSLENGKRQYALDIYYVLKEEEFVLDCQTVYMEKADCVVCYITGTSKRWLVWDLTTESSKTGDETNYVYQWQNPDNPEQEVLLKLQSRAAELGKKYGVDIYLGEAVKDCPKDIYEYKVSNNIIRIEKMLNLLEQALEKYPEGMLAQLENDGYGDSRLQIYLAGEIIPVDETGINSIGIQGTIDGITFLVLDINCFGDLENTIYHEIFHAIENHLNANPDAYFDYEIWDGLNPEGFFYDLDYKINEQSEDYAYTIDDTEHEIYFVDVYSKSFPNEDRARIIEYAMLEDGDKRKNNIKESRIQAKLKYICEQVRKGFDTTGWPEKTSWEKALN